MTALAVAPNANGIAVGVQGGDDHGGSLTAVHWWNWQGHGSLPLQAFKISALTWDKDGTLLAGNSENGRVSQAQWWRIGPQGKILAACNDYPLGQNTVRLYAMERGINSIAVLDDGKVVTGGVDASLAVWEGCMPTWLNVENCCYAESEITVLTQGKSFLTIGEGIWQNEELGYRHLGPRLWSPSPWQATQSQHSVLGGGPGLHAAAQGCSATLTDSGQITLAGPLSWTASLGKGGWKHFAVSSDCSAVAAASNTEIVWLVKPRGN